MYAAVVRSFDEPPRYEAFETPEPVGDREIAVDVLAAGLHPRVRSGASGSHYTSTEALPLIPGIDGVGRSADGQLLYFIGATGNAGQMAVQIAKFLGAGHVTAAGRDAERLSKLTSLGADETVSLAGDSDETAQALEAAGADVDVVIDYL